MMEKLSIIIGMVTALCTTGGIIYLIIEKLFSRREDNAKAKSSEIQNSNDIADLYDKIDSIVERKTAPIRGRLADMEKKLEELTSRWVCYKDCPERVLYKKDICIANKINTIANEASSAICGGKSEESE